jgi:pSer/pThr/pTyr-binding forkhead associated (FHA) protein
LDVFSLIAKDRTGQTLAVVAVTEQPLLVGRGDTCAVVLPSTGVSRIHASLFLYGDAVVLNDEGSANGVRVDGEQISGPTLVNETNQIQISTFTLELVRNDGVTAEKGAAVGDPALAVPAAGPQREQEDEDTCLEPRSGAAEALARSNLVLVGRGGTYNGARFALDRPLMTVGRERSDIVLEDPSISRRHAQLRLSATGQRLTVVDLRSSNGTFVGGQRVKRSEVEEHAVIRFGDLAFRLEAERKGETQQRKRAARSPRRRLLIAIASIALLVVGVGLVAKMLKDREPGKETPPKQTPSLEDRRVRLQRLIDQAQSRLIARKWDETLSSVSAVLDLDPLNELAPRIRKQALDEKANQRIYDQGQKLAEGMQMSDLIRAKELFEQIGKDSSYGREAQDVIRNVNLRIARRHREEAVARCRAKYWQECAEAACKYFAVLPANAPVRGLARFHTMMLVAEKKLIKQKDFRACAHKLPGDMPQTEQNTDEILARLYPEEEIRQVVALYIEGKMGEAQKRLAKLRLDRKMRPHLTLLDNVGRQLNTVQGRWQSGYSSHRARNVDAADKEWGVLIGADKLLIGSEISYSFYRDEARRLLGTLYFDLGEEKFQAARYRDAFERWQRGRVVSPRQQSLLSGMQQLEGVAVKLIAEGEKLVAAGNRADARLKLALARDICDVGRPVHKKAVDALKALGDP